MCVGGQGQSISYHCAPHVVRTPCSFAHPPLVLICTPEQCCGSAGLYVLSTYRCRADASRILNAPPPSRVLCVHPAPDAVM
ncbi:hypothetical protein GDO81_008427 [Engystomops pustulosus]|uniref:Uncharacterized protein n=1 Tax=Engystomops pustulosus TaxID=76066 RepID=A0AAV7CGB0_ENGPU|nr:hypothetical protein GDO81_008427 [Engystomops pustulosus]